MTSYKQKKRTDYKTCSYCGAALDPGERCDCQDGFLLAVAWKKKSPITDPAEGHRTRRNKNGAYFTT